MKKLLIFIFLLLASCFLFLTCVFCQTTYNLQIIFKKGCPPVPPGANPAGASWGKAINGVEDVNKDGFDEIVVGAFADYGPPNTDTLFCHLFLGGNQFDTIPDLVFRDWCGGTNTLSICGGDLNGDGYSDVAIVCGAGLYIYLGGNPMDTTPDFFLPYVENVFVPIAVACGDVNGDDTTDLIVGDYWDPDGKGQVRIYHGSANFDLIPDIILYGGHGDSGEEFGFSVGSGGDANKDGFEDVAVGAFCYGDGPNAPFSAGRVYVYYGGSPMDTVYDMAKCGEQAGGYLGECNVDFFDDSVDFAGLTAGYTEWNGAQGKTWCWFGGSPMDSVVDIEIIGVTDTSWEGYWVSTAGWINRGKCQEVISGAAGETVFGSRGGIWLGEKPMDNILDAYIMSTAPYKFLGDRVACAGDVNGDTRNEVMVSNYTSDSLPTVWVCKYTGPEGTEEQQNAECGMRNAECRLMQNCPNPFSHTTVISYQLSVNSNVSLKIYNLAGQLVKTLVNELTSSRFIGMRSVVWDGRDESGKCVASGVYFYRLQAGDFTAIKKMILLR